MEFSSRLSAAGFGSLEILFEEGELVFGRTQRQGAGQQRQDTLILLPASGQPTSATLDRLNHEYSIKDELDSAWAVRPLELLQDRGGTILILEDPGGELLGSHLGAPMDPGSFLPIAIGLAAAIGNVHRRGLIHKDINPANVLVNDSTNQVWLTGFGIASRLPRERQTPDPPEVIAGTLPYMAPEQTGRMNRSIDSRSDLYSLGITFYQMLTGSLPFTAQDPLEWVHCHIAKTPVPPHQRLETIPAPISRLVMKLLAKTAEERYQTAAGVEHDLRQCRDEWKMRGRIDEFPLAEHDLPDRLLIPEKLYGRSREVAALLGSFDHIIASGVPELVLVSGYSGVGKSSVVNELHKVLVPPRGLFASGKFDQYKRDVPYATVAQAFQTLVRQILTKSDAELQSWREALREALGPNGLLIVDLIPELELVIGKQPPVAELSPQDAQRRFQTVLRRFIAVFARPEHPLALFLDDLQWLDAATLDLLEDILAQRDIRHLLLIGAYRDNEVDATHPLMRKLDAIRRAGATVQDIVLAPLNYDHLAQLITDALRCETDRVRDLAQLILQKTGGNPFFINQFLSILTDEGLIAFDSVHSRWSWDLKRIHAKGYTDNVADLMIGKLVRLPVATRQALQQLACLGNVATAAMLAMVHDGTGEELHASLVEARRQEVVDLHEGSYRFVHDRVHEAAYALIPAERRTAMHLRIGRMLVAHAPPEKREEIIFEIVNQLNRGAELITAEEERYRLAELNLVAGKRAQASSAHVSALNYLKTGAALLTEESWQQRHELTFALELARAHCEFASEMIAESEKRLRALSTRAVTTGERVAVACLQVELYQGVGRSVDAVAVGLLALRRLGVDFPESPTEVDARRAYDGIWTLLGSRAIADLIHLPHMNDPDSLAAADLLIRVAIPVHYSGSDHLLAVIICTAVSLGLEQGHSDASCFAYAQLGTLAGPHFGQFDAGYRFARLGCELVERPGLQRFRARTFAAFGFLAPWTQHVREGREFLFRAFDLASRTGEISYASYACGQLITNYLMAGDSLIEAQGRAEHALGYVRKAGFATIEGWILGQLGLIRTLRGLTIRLGSFDDALFRESDLERDLAGEPALTLPECWYYIRKLQARFFAGEYVEALQAASRAQPKLKGTLSLLDVVEYHFYDALCHAAVHDSASLEDRELHRAKLAEHLEKFDAWANLCPENFENRTALIRAEVARIEGRDADAMRLYEQAIRSARANGFVHNGALAYETAARFYSARGLDDFAELYLLRARDGYRRWGADGKVRQLDRLYPHLAGSERQGSAAATGSAVQHLDVRSVVKASQALSSEIELPKLIEQLMKIAIENAGADRGLLMLPSGDEYLIHAEARATGDEIKVAARQQPITGSTCPESLVHYVIRTRQIVILDDASKSNPFSVDAYLREQQSKSILCLPLIKQRQLTGLLLLENTLTSHAFTADRIAVLELIAAQAAISLEISHLYAERLRAGAELQLQVELLQQLPVSAWTLKPDGTPDFVNRVWLEFAGQTLDFVRSHPEAWMTAVHPEDRESVAKSFWKGVQSGHGFAFEARSLRAHDGVYRRHLQQAVVLRDADGKVLRFVGTTTDIDDQKRAEEALRQAAAELAHANRVATMGQLTASIAHEVNNPIAALLMNAETAVRWLDRESPNSEKAKTLIDRTISDGKRAADIVSRIRNFSKKAPAQKEDLEINKAILEIMTLARAAVSDHGVLVKMHPSEGLPHTSGDRIQLQQVILNLVMNAIEAMSEVTEGPRELSITTSLTEAGGVLVAVSDSGPGLTNPERVFDAFYTTKANGLGMGLSICRSIIQNHGGRLWATPNEPRGTVFYVMLPIGEKELENPEVAGS